MVQWHLLQRDRATQRDPLDVHAQPSPVIQPGMRVGRGTAARQQTHRPCAGRQCEKVEPGFRVERAQGPALRHHPQTGITRSLRLESRETHRASAICQ